jgi:hypothetical protein
MAGRGKDFNYLLQCCYSYEVDQIQSGGFIHLIKQYGSQVWAPLLIRVSLGGYLFFSWFIGNGGT